MNHQCVNLADCSGDSLSVSHEKVFVDGVSDAAPGTSHEARNPFVTQRWRKFCDMTHGDSVSHLAKFTPRLNLLMHDGNVGHLHCGGLNRASE